MKFLLLVFSFCFIAQINCQIIITAVSNRTPFSGGDGGLFANATFDHAGDMLYDKAGNLYIAEVRGRCIRKVDAISGIITTIINDVYTPRGMALDRQGLAFYFVADFCVRRYDLTTKAITLFAGTPNVNCSYFAACGENGPAVSAIFDNPQQLAVDSIGNVYVADDGDNRIRKIDIATGLISTYAGGGGCNCAGYGDGGPAIQAQLSFPSGVCFDKQGNLLIAEYGIHNVRKVDSKTGIITTVAGLNSYPSQGYNGDNIPAVSAKLSAPTYLSADANGNVYIVDQGNSRIRKVDEAGIITTVAGSETGGYAGDCGPPDKAELYGPSNIIISPGGNMLISDYGNNAIREIINAKPNVIKTSINTLCLGNTLKLVDSAEGGVWQSSNPSVAEVSAIGTVTAISEGTTNVSYFISNGCNTNSSSVTLTVYSVPSVPRIQGSSTVCEASTIQLSNTTADGIWTTSDSSIAIPDNAGLVKGISGGTALIRYTLSNGYCKSSDSIKISVSPLPYNQPIKGDTAICVNSATTLTNAGIGGVWSINNSGIASINALNGTVNGISAGKAIVTYTISNSCGFSQSQTVLKISPLPAFSLGNDTAICTNNELVLKSSLTGVSYLWEDGSKESSRIVIQPNLYWLKITDSNHCFFSDTINVQNKPLPFLHIGNDTTLCNNLPFTISVGDVSIVKYTWQDGTSLPFYTIQQPGQYSVSVTGNNSCVNSDTINIQYQYSPIINIGSNESICPGNPVIIDPKLNNVTYLWQDGSTKSTYPVIEPGTYILKATNTCGTTTASVEFKPGVCQLFMPTAFTPNKDGLNDVFRVRFPQFIKTFHLQIWDRWGLLIFETTNPRSGWDGKYKNLDQDAGNYLWQINLTDFESKTQSAKGSILLIR